MAEVVGPEEGDVVFYLHGTPGTRFLDEEMLDVGIRRGLRYVIYSRPGYEGSDRHLGRTVADCVTDIAAIADQLGIQSFYVVGESGGGPHALACGAGLRERVRAVAAIAGSAPFEAEGLDWFEDMAKTNCGEFEAILGGDVTGMEYLGDLREKIGVAENLKQVLEVLGDLFGEEEAEVFEGGFGDHVFAFWKGLSATDLEGWYDDSKAHLSPWGFQLGQVTVPVVIWHGEADKAVPFAHGEWLASHLPNAELRRLATDGHASVVDHYGAILDDLIASSY